MNLTDAQYMARDLMNRHGLGHWIFTFDGAKTRNGQTSHRRSTISMSRHLTTLRDEFWVRNTILHEIAHALVGPGHGHDRVWQAKAISIGCTGTRCSEDKVNVQKNWRGVCVVAGHTLGERFRRPPARNNYSCPKCSPKYDARFPIRWVPIA